MYHLQSTTFVSFPSFTSNLKLKTHSQLTQSKFIGTDRLFINILFDLNILFSHFDNNCKLQ